jgi:hypothetical protein
MGVKEGLIMAWNTDCSNLDFTIKIWERLQSNFSRERPVPCSYEMGHELLL